MARSLQSWHRYGIFSNLLLLFMYLKHGMDECLLCSYGDGKSNDLSLFKAGTKHDKQLEHWGDI